MPKAFRHYDAPDRCQCCEHERTLRRCVHCDRWLCLACCQGTAPCAVCEIVQDANGRAR